MSEIVGRCNIYEEEGDGGDGNMCIRARQCACMNVCASAR